MGLFNKARNKLIDRQKTGQKVFGHGLSLLLLLFLIGLGFRYRVLYTQELRYDVQKSQFDSVVPLRSAECHVEDYIEYFYYLEPPEEEKANNKFGLYIYAENADYFSRAEELVNSNGGDWGYVLIPFNVQHRDYEKWARVFRLTQEKHLIPVVQLWGLELDNYEEQTIKAADFLNSFAWPTKSRYISVYNEPNDAGFWYDKIDPGEYARILNFTIDTFKEENPDFYMMNGALNSSAPSNGVYMDSEVFMTAMNEEIPGIFNKLDGWASHPYPQPNFSGDPYDTGRWSIKAYEEELKFLKENLNLNKELPVFITETGWAHAEGKNWNAGFLPVSEVADNYETAFRDVWLPDDRVVAVIPFTIWYEPPYDHFSWLNADGVPYEHFERIKKMKKVAGNPSRLEKAHAEVLTCEDEDALN